MDMEHIRRVKIYPLSKGDYPEALVTLGEHVVGDLPDLVARARILNPAVRLDAVVASIWRLGSYRLRQNLLSRMSASSGKWVLCGSGLRGETMIVRQGE